MGQFFQAQGQWEWEASCPEDDLSGQYLQMTWDVLDFGTERGLLSVKMNRLKVFWIFVLEFPNRIPRGSLKCLAQLPQRGWISSHWVVVSRPEGFREGRI